MKLIEPVGVVVETDRPAFRWAPAEGATFQVGVYDDRFAEVARSEWLHTTTWTPLAPLPRGRRYSWQLTIRREGSEFTVPAPPAPEARFRVLSAGAALDLDSLRKDFHDSHLLLAVAYQRAGLLDRARQEIKLLQAGNPGSDVVQQLVSNLTAAHGKSE